MLAAPSTPMPAAALQPSERSPSAPTPVAAAPSANQDGVYVSRGGSSGLRFGRRTGSAGELIGSTYVWSIESSGRCSIKSVFDREVNIEWILLGSDDVAI